MWATILVMAAAVSLEPIRIGLTVMMLNRPRPLLQLLMFLSGGFVMGLAVGFAVLFILRHRVSGATYFTVPRVQIVIGLLALLLAAVLATNLSARHFQRTADDSDSDVVAVVSTTAHVTENLSTRARRLRQGDSLWAAGVVGLGIALPSVDYMAALAVILASGAAPAVQVAALLTFNVVAFALVEIPLIGYLAAPARTTALMAALHDWIRTRRRRDVAAVLAAAGTVMIAIGVAGL
jgi:membrane protein implicated in regulation of membrane protease activity